MTTRNTSARGRTTKGANEPKTLFHSELVRACENGPVVITVLTDAKPNPVAGKPPVALIEYDGAERAYWCDNENVERFFDGQEGRTFEMMADGGKGEEVLSYIGEAQRPERKKQERAPAADKGKKNPPPSNPPPPRNNQAANTSTAPAQTAEREPESAEQKEAHRLEREANYMNALHECKVAAGRHTVLAAIASDAAETVAARHFKKFKKAMPEDRVQGIAMRIMISLDRLVGKLPSNIDKYLPVEDKPAANTSTAQPSDNDGAQS